MVSIRNHANVSTSLLLLHPEQKKVELLARLVELEKT